MSNPPPGIITYILKDTECRLSRNSPSKDIFELKKKEYETVLREEGAQNQIKLQSSTQPTRKKEAYLVHPPLFNLEVKTNLD